LKKAVKIAAASRALLPTPRSPPALELCSHTLALLLPPIVTGLLHFVECVSSAKRVLLRSEKQATNVLEDVLHLLLCL